MGNVRMDIFVNVYIPCWTVGVVEDVLRIVKGFIWTLGIAFESLSSLFVFVYLYLRTVHNATVPFFALLYRTLQTLPKRIRAREFWECNHRDMDRKFNDNMLPKRKHRPSPIENDNPPHHSQKDNCDFSHRRRSSRSRGKEKHHSEAGRRRREHSSHRIRDDDRPQRAPQKGSDTLRQILHDVEPPFFLCFVFCLFVLAPTGFGKKTECPKKTLTNPSSISRPVWPTLFSSAT